MRRLPVRPALVAPTWMAVVVLVALTAACGGSRRSDADFAALYTAQAGGGVASYATQAPNAAAGTGAGGGSALSGSSGVPGAPAGAAASAPVGGVSSGGAVASSSAPGRAPAAGPAAAGSTGASASGTPIRLATVGVMTGPIGGALANIMVAAQVWAAKVNSEGGIRGHAVQLLIADDGSDPAKHVALVKQMVEEKHVVAFVDQVDVFTGQAAVPYLEQQRVPVVGGSGGSPWFNTSPMYFSQMANDTVLADTFAGEMATIGKPQGLTKIAIVYCAEVQGCANATRPEAFQKRGLDPVYTAKVSLGQPDYTAQCLSARNAGAQMVFMGLDGQGVQRLADDCANIGYKPLFGHTAQGTALAELNRPSLEGTAVGAPTAPWFTSQVPAVAEFMSAMSRFAPGVTPDGAAIQGWTGGQLLEAALRAAPDPTTSSGILHGLWSIKGNDLGGLTYPISFRQGAPNNAESEQGCWWIVRIQGGRFVSPDGGQRHCA